MGEATLVFDPFSQEFFDNPYEFYRWMRAETPVYYSDQYDFYALTRHEDVAAAYKDYETYNSAYGVDLAMVQSGGAGAETVTKLLASAVHVFARNPDQWVKLLEDRNKVPAAVEELLRYDNPVQYDVRRSMKEVTLHGVTIPVGKPVFLLLASANRDPKAWTDADRFDIERDRTVAQNIGLGYGIHSCLGAALARMESSIALEELLDFMPRYEVDWDGCKRVHMANVVGWSSVPVRVIR
jgi:cytochrome P450